MPACLNVRFRTPRESAAKFSRNEKDRYKTLEKLRKACGTPLALQSGMEGRHPRRMIFRLAVAMMAADGRIIPSELSTAERSREGRAG
jgi:hypothetical protein